MNDTQPLWRLFASLGVTDDALREGSQRLLALEIARRFGGGLDVPLQVPIVVTRVEEVVEVPYSVFADVYIPLILLLAKLAEDARVDGRRLLVGVVAPAGAGKSTLCALLTVLGNAWIDAMVASGSSMHAVRGILTLSMDGYHRPHAVLTAFDLVSVKGRRDTIDSRSFARDLLALGAVPRPAAIPLPEYDRATLHDSVNDAFVALPHHDVVLVEGLHLLSATEIGSGATESVPAVEPFMRATHVDSSTSSLLSAPEQVDGVERVGTESADDARAWLDVANTLDVVIALAVPMLTCRARTTRRKVAGGWTRDMAEQHYDRVDLPVWVSLSEQDALKPVRIGGIASKLHAVVRSPVEGVVGATSTTTAVDSRVQAQPLGNRGPDVVLHMDDAVSESSRSIAVRGVVVRAPAVAPMPAPEIVTNNVGAGGATIVVVGMTPCVQRTLVYGPIPSAASDAAKHPADAVAWRRGHVNRAGDGVVTVGGKGQHVAIAVARAEAHRNLSAARGGLSVKLHDFQGGTAGHQAAAYFDHAVARANAEGVDPALTVSVAHMSTMLLESQPTRTCTTVLDTVVHDMTEFIEPPCPVTAEQTDALLKAVRQSLQCRADTTSNVPPRRVLLALMGTVPAGAEAVYETLSTEVASAPVPPLVLLDAFRGALRALDAGGISILKVNADELAALAEEVARIGAGVAPSAAAATLPAPVRNAVALLRWNRYSARGTGLQIVAVTAGASDAFVVRASDATACGCNDGILVHRFKLPSHLPPPGCEVNSIGAGDTVAGVALCGLATGSPLELVYADALAAGTASVLTLRGAEWSRDVAAYVRRRIRVSAECVWL